MLHLRSIFCGPASEEVAEKAVEYLPYSNNFISMDFVHTLNKFDISGLIITFFLVIKMSQYNLFMS